MENTKVILIPDLHGRMFWKEAVANADETTRKATVSRVLHGRNAGWDELLEMCGQEMLDSRTGHQIGFRPQAR